MEEPRGRYSRGYLPHIDAGRFTQFITFRLADSLPSALLRSWKEELQSLEEPVRKRELYSRVEKYLDQGHGTLALRNPISANIVQEAVRFYEGSKYELHAWCVMPNHVHMLVTPSEGASLTEIVRPIKSYSAKCIHDRFGGSGRFWQPDFFDRLVRNEQHYERVAKYIEWNPVKAKLCTDPGSWPYSSFSFRRLRAR